MYLIYAFESDELVIKVGGVIETEDSIKISKDDFIKWLGLTDVIKSYKLAAETAEKL